MANRGRHSSNAAWAPVRCAAVLLGALGLAACTPDFQGQEIVRDLRVLAIQTDPPEAIVDVANGTVDDVKVTLLFADPNHPSSTAAIQGALCTSGDGARCGEKAVHLSPFTSAPGAASFQLLPSLPDPSKFVQLVFAAQQSDALKGLGGILLQLELDVSNPDQYSPQSAIKSLLFSPKTADSERTRNRLPVIQTLQLLEGTVASSTLLDGQTINLRVGQQLGFRPLLTPSSTETYTTIDLSGKSVTLTENPSWSFYTTPGGELDNATADEPLPGVSAPPLGLTRFQSKTPGTGTIWAVVRDGRGGVAWTVHPWRAQ